MSCATDAKILTIGDATSAEALEVTEIHQTIPNGLEVKDARYGYGVFATRFFPKGSIVYTGRQIVIPNKFAEFKLVINGTNQVFFLNTETHSVEFNDSHRWLYLFDSFMNHSCEPTTRSRQTESQREDNEYDTVALVDIHPGDQITCDYNLFEYDCHGKEIEQCLCGSENCIGRIAGFKYLPIPQKKLRLQSVEKEVLEAMSADPFNKFFYIPCLKTPLELVSLNRVDSQSMQLVALKDFEVGDVVYSNESLIFAGDCHIIIELDGQRKWLNNLIHTVNRGNGKREFFYFDSFQNHSCDPNTYMVYHSENHYDVIACKPILVGDEITGDYDTFDTLRLDGTTFNCCCGAANCRGVVNA